MALCVTVTFNSRRQTQIINSRYFAVGLGLYPSLYVSDTMRDVKDISLHCNYCGMLIYVIFRIIIFDDL